MDNWVQNVFINTKVEKELAEFLLCSEGKWYAHDCGYNEDW